MYQVRLWELNEIRNYCLIAANSYPAFELIRQEDLEEFVLLNYAHLEISCK